MSFAWTARPFFSCFSSLNKLLNHSSSTMRLTASINNWKQEGPKSNKNRTRKCWNEIGYLGVLLVVLLIFHKGICSLQRKKENHLLYLAGVSNACFTSCSGPRLCHQFLIFFKALYWSWDERILSWFDWMQARGIKFLWLLHVELLQVLIQIPHLEQNNPNASSH